MFFVAGASGSKDKAQGMDQSQDAEFQRKRNEDDGRIQGALFLKDIPLYRGCRGGPVTRVD